MNFFWSQRLEMDLKWTRDHSYWNVTICLRDSHSNANKGHRFPKCTSAGHSIGQTLALWANVILFLQAFQKIIVILWIMPWSTPIGLRHDVLAVAHEGKRQYAIALRVGITHVTINYILLRHATTGSLGPGKSPVFREDSFKSACALTERMRNLYGVRAGRKTINNRLETRGYRARRPLRKTPLTAHHRRMRLAWAQRGRNPTVAQWQHIIFGDESRFQLYPVDGQMGVCRLPGERFLEDSQVDRVQAGGESIHMQNHLLCSWIGTWMGWCTGPFYGTDWCHLKAAFRWELPLSRRQCYASSCQGSHCLPPAGEHHQDGPAIKIPRLLP